MQGSAQDAHHSSVPSGSFVTGNTVTPMHGRWVLPEDAMMLGSSSGPTGRRKGRKKVPPVDLSRVTDPEERKRQRRLMKNRETAAASRCVVSKRVPHCRGSLSEGLGGRSGDVAPGRHCHRCPAWRCLLRRFSLCWHIPERGGRSASSCWSSKYRLLNDKMKL